MTPNWAFKPQVEASGHVLGYGRRLQGWLEDVGERAVHVASEVQQAVASSTSTMPIDATSAATGGSGVPRMPI